MKPQAVFDVFPAGAGDHFIAHGVVGCPVRACDVGIETCAACPWLVEIEPDGARPFVRCRPERARVGIEWLSF